LQSILDADQREACVACHVGAFAFSFIEWF
jgi:hypothetical protein